MSACGGGGRPAPTPEVVRPAPSSYAIIIIITSATQGTVVAVGRWGSGRSARL